MTMEPSRMREVCRATAARNTLGEGAMSSGVR